MKPTSRKCDLKCGKENPNGNYETNARDDARN